jgi:hypothetical protein
MTSPGEKVWVLWVATDIAEEAAEQEVAVSLEAAVPSALR